MLELIIVPDISGGSARASLVSLCLGQSAGRRVVELGSSAALMKHSSPATHRLPNDRIRTQQRGFR
jgi:hypothetical protein